MPDLPLSGNEDLDPSSFICFVVWDYLPVRSPSSFAGLH